MLPPKTNVVMLNGIKYNKSYLGMDKSVCKRYIGENCVEQIMVNTLLVIDVQGTWYSKDSTLLPLREGIRITYI